MKKQFVFICLLLLLAIIGSGCGSASGEQTSAPPANSNTVIIQDFKFQPAEITIKKGETVTWTNNDSVKHTATCDTFDSGLLAKGESFSFTFEETGTYDYLCTPHPYMKGKVHVE